MKKFLNKLFIETTDNGFIQFFRFIFVGGFATVVDIGVGWIFAQFIIRNDVSVFGLLIPSDVVSAAIGFIFGLVVNYFLSVLWIFKRDDINRVVEFLSFAVIGIIGLLIKSGSMWLMDGIIPGQDGIQFIIKSIIGTFIAFIWNFSARKFILYRKPKNEKSAEPEETK